MKHMLNRKNLLRSIAPVVAAAVLVFTLFSSLYIVKEAGHHCASHDTCPICSMLAQCEANLRQASTGRITAAIECVLICVFFAAFIPVPSEASCETPITRKVRLND